MGAGNFGQLLGYYLLNISFVHAKLLLPNLTLSGINNFHKHTKRKFMLGVSCFLRIEELLDLAETKLASIFATNCMKDVAGFLRHTFFRES